MMVDLAVRNGTLVTPDTTIEADLLVESGNIAGIVSPGASVDAETVVDADGSLVLPGVVDPHVHVSETSDAYEAESKAAALGGVTSFITFGAQVTPESESPRTLHESVEAQYEAGETSVVDFAVHPIISREVTGRVEQTYLRGECLVENGEFVGETGYGESLDRTVPDWEN